MIIMTSNKLKNKIIKLIEKEKSESICLRSKVGAVVVKNGRIISSAHNGNCSYLLPCSIIGCAKKYFSPRAGQRNEMCTGLCAEQRAIIKALSNKCDLKGAEVYCNYSPCVGCSRIFAEVGIKTFYFQKEYKDALSRQILKMAGIEMVKI